MLKASIGSVLGESLGKSRLQRLACLGVSAPLVLIAVIGLPLRSDSALMGVELLRGVLRILSRASAFDGVLDEASVESVSGSISARRPGAESPFDGVDLGLEGSLLRRVALFVFCDANMVGLESVFSTSLGPGKS